MVKNTILLLLETMEQDECVGLYRSRNIGLLFSQEEWHGKLFTEIWVNPDSHKPDLREPQFPHI